MKFSNSQKQTKSTTAHPPFTNQDQLIRKMCHQMLQHNNEREQQSKATPHPPMQSGASSSGSLLNKMHRHRKLVHQHRGCTARSVSPSKTCDSTGSSHSRRRPATATAPFSKHPVVSSTVDDHSMTSRVFGKRFKSPTSSSSGILDIGYSSSVEAPSDDKPDFLRYKSSASLYCFGKGVRGSSGEERTTMDNHFYPYRAPSFSFDTQSSAATSFSTAPPRNVETQQQLLRHRRKPASYTTQQEEVRDQPQHRRKQSYMGQQEEVRDQPQHRRKQSYDLPRKQEERKDEPQHRRKPSYDLLLSRSSQLHSPFRVDSRDDDVVEASSKRPSPIPRSLCFSPSPAAMEEEMKRAEQRMASLASTPPPTKCLFPVRTTTTTNNKVLSTGSGAFRQIAPASSLSTTSSDAENQQPRSVLRHSPRNRGLANQQETPSTTRTTKMPLVLRGSSSSTDVSVVSTPPPPLTDLGALRLKYAEEFVREIDLYRTGERSSPDPPTTTTSSKSGRLSVFIRKRPMLAGEREMGDFDVIRVLKDRKSKHSCSAVTVFRTNVTTDKETKLIQPLCFGGGFSAVFDASVENDRVYRAAVKPLVRCATLHHKAATLLLCGQIGSGKRYTMSSCQKLLATEIFSSAHSRGAVHEVQCLELVGKACFDLLNTETTRVTVVDTEDGGVNLQGAQKVRVNSTRELVSVFSECEDRRISGRSHVVYQIRCSRGSTSLGLLTLVSCAGTERACSKASYAETAEVNASMFALKECIRVRSSLQSTSRVPYRASNLTRVLRECLEKEGSEISVIGTLSAKATDTENSISTLKLTSGLVGAQWQEGDSRKIHSKMITEKAQLSPKDWDHQDLVSWLSKRDLIGRKRIPSYLNGKAVMKMSRVQLESILYSGDSDAEEKSTRLFRSLRHESERVMRSDLRRKMSMVGLAN